MYPVVIAANDPFGILIDGARRSPLIFIPAKIPVTVGKNTPKTVNQLFPSVYEDQVLFWKLPVNQPSKPLSKIKNKLKTPIIPFN